MRLEKKTVLLLILLIFFITLGISITANLSALQKNFLFADEAKYYMMTQSLGQDGDLEYTRRDLIRYYRDFTSLPLGIFLKEGKNQKIFYAKSFAYPVFAFPFVKIFGFNGFLVFHSFLLLLLLLMGFKYFSGHNQNELALLQIITFLFAAVAAVYFFWMSPDFFNLFLVFSILFLWLYKHTSGREKNLTGKNSRIDNFLLSDWSDYLAGLLAAVAVYSKPPNIAVLGPLVLFYLIKKKPLKSLIIIVIFLAVSVLFWGSNQYITGDWNYQGGKRKTFYGEGGYPLEKEHLTFDTARGGLMTSEGYSDKHFFPPRIVFYNLFYYFFGRFSGITWYFFPAFLALVIFFSRKKSLYQWLILVALAGEILIYIVFMPDNYAGGGGALANRYFLCIYPFFFFLHGLKIEVRDIALCWGVASIFVAQILISPIQHSHFPATHTKRFPFKILPVELTLINNLPTNTNPAARRQSVGTKYSWLYFLDDNFTFRTKAEQEKYGFWTKGPGKAEMILKTWYPIKSLTFRIRNNPRKTNEITVTFAGEKKRLTLGYQEWGTVTFTPKKVFQMNQWIRLYKLSVKAAKGSIPHYETEKSDERRYLGVWFELDIIPEYMPD